MSYLHLKTVSGRALAGRTIAVILLGCGTTGAAGPGGEEPATVPIVPGVPMNKPNRGSDVVPKNGGAPAVPMRPAGGDPLDPRALGFKNLRIPAAGGRRRGRSGPWPVAKARRWHEQQAWLSGCNFIPSSAVNQLEMWQAETFDPQTIDRELGWAAGLGFNMVRVYLHDLAYQQDPGGFLDRIERYLGIADKHGIRTLAVFFDDCWLIEPKVGKQPEPVPGRHNSGWLESPGWRQVDDFAAGDGQLAKRLKGYVQAVMRRFADDPRVLGWDLYNEPGGVGKKADGWHQAHGDGSAPLLEAVFDWAWEVNPSQPLTSGYYRADFKQVAKLQLERSDILTFHHYGPADRLRGMIEEIGNQAGGRPVSICTEYMAREAGSTFEGCMPVLKEKKIGAVNWGLVAGKTNTIYPWQSWRKPGKLPEPELWFHDIFRRDGTPFREEEVELIRGLTGENAQ